MAVNNTWTGDSTWNSAQNNLLPDRWQYLEFSAKQFIARTGDNTWNSAQNNLLPGQVTILGIQRKIIYCPDKWQYLEFSAEQFISRTGDNTWNSAQNTLLPEQVTVLGILRRIPWAAWLVLLSLSSVWLPQASEWVRGINQRPHNIQN